MWDSHSISNNSTFLSISSFYIVSFLHPPSIYLYGIVLTLERSGPCAQAWREPAAAAAAAAGVAAVPGRGSCVWGPGTDLGGRRSDSYGAQAEGLLGVVE